MKKTPTWQPRHGIGKCFGVVFLILLSFGGALSACHTKSIGMFSGSTPSVATSKTASWLEDRGVFYTTDVKLAQGEIPFTILLPDASAAPNGNLPSANISGPLRTSQKNGEVEIEILYKLPGEGASRFRFLHLAEQNFPILPPSPDLNPDVEIVQVRGVDVYGSRLNTVERANYQFDQDGVWVNAISEGVPLDYSFSLVASMIR